MIFRTTTLSLTAVALSGCATASFSPPSTNIVNEMEVRGSNFSFAKRCKPQERTRDGSTDISRSNLFPLGKDADGAIALANNFIYEYRCAAHSAGNSRQAFEVPGLLAGIGSAAALAFGAGSDVAIAGGVATASADGAKDYYAPLKKAEIYTSSLDAFLCIKSTSVGVEPFIISGETVARKAAGNPPTNKGAATPEGARSTSREKSYFSPERRYFELVSSALFTVERISATRLRNSANYDVAGVIAQIEQIKEKIEKAESSETENANNRNAEAIIENNGDAGGSDGGNTTVDKKDQAAKDKNEVDDTKNGSTIAQNTTANARVLGSSLTKLEILKPKLEKCILRAKL